MSLAFAKAEAKARPGWSYIIISQAPGEGKSQSERRLAHSHAVKWGLKDRKKQQEKSGAASRNAACTTRPRRLLSKGPLVETLAPSLCFLAVGILDPFQTLPIDSTRLQTLLSNNKARQAPEPVFSLADELAFQSFRAVFRTGTADAALLSALMMSLTFAMTEGKTDRECLEYKGQTLSCLRVKMRSLSDATSESTIGAILLLAGVEARLGITFQAQLHMSAVRRLLDMSQEQGIYLSGGIKRALFWQDLNSSVIAGTSRIVDHATFDELQWKRDPCSPTFYRLPIGFQEMAWLLSEQFVEVLEDLHAMQCIRDMPRSGEGNPMLMEQINNHTASIQSRLAALPNWCPIMESCRLAAYLCSVTLCCTMWCALVIPVSIATQLLCSVQRAAQEPKWDEHHDLLLWIIYIGGAFAPIGQVRSGYIELLRMEKENKKRRLLGSWPEVPEVLRHFIWSEKAFIVPVKAFWEEASA